MKIVTLPSSYLSDVAEWKRKKINSRRVVEEVRIYYILPAVHRKNGERVEKKETTGVNKLGAAIPRIKYDTRGMELYFNLYPPRGLDFVIPPLRNFHSKICISYLSSNLNSTVRPNNFLPEHSLKKMTPAWINHSALSLGGNAHCRW